MTEHDRLRRIAARWCSATTLERVVDPMLADFATEDAAATERGGKHARGSIRVAYVIACVKVMALCAIYELVQWPASLTSDDGRAARRVIWIACAVSAAVTALLVMPPLLQQQSLGAASAPARGYVDWAALVTLLIPQGLTVALPIGLMSGIMGTGARTAWRRSGPLVLIIAAACCAVAFVNVAWISPAANQLFRVMVSRVDITRGVPELSLGELRDLLSAGNHVPMNVSRPADVASLSWMFHMRLTLAVAPFVLGLCALATVRRWRPSATQKLAAAFLMSVVYYVCIWGMRQLVLERAVPAPLAIWTPTAILLVVSFAMLIHRTTSDSTRDSAGIVQ